MVEHPSSEQLALYQSRALTSGGFLSIHRHIVTCPVCSARCPVEASLKHDYEILVSAVTPDPHEADYHLTTAELTGYVRESLNELDSESASSHLEVCTVCRQAEARLRVTILSEPLPGRAATTDKEPVQKVGAMTFLHPGARPLRIAALLLIVIGSVLLGWVLLRSRLAQPPARDITNTHDRETIPRSSPADHTAAPSPNGVQASAPTEGAVSKPDSTNIPDKVSEEIPASASPDLRRAILAAVTTQQLDKPRILSELGGSAGRLLGNSSNGLPFRLLSPVSKVILDQQPTFDWQPLAGASSYVVTIADDQLNEVATSGQLTNTNWKIPIKLKQGATYSWQVTAFKDGQKIASPVMPAPQAKFRILDRSQRDELMRMKRAMPNYHLGLGVLYTRAGLLEDAEREFEALAKDKSHSAIGVKLLNRVRSMN